ncbi:hypothetical protein BSKO_00429 [Bryopsis sp. KO-2023]|nr:hypothetical protein BSKO_00429 [Bryopsis sp. KO-2023]
MLKVVHPAYLAVVFLILWTAAARHIDVEDNPVSGWEDESVEEHLQGHYHARRLVNDSNLSFDPEEEDDEDEIIGLDKKYFFAIVIAGPFLLIPCCCYAAHFCREKRKDAPYESETETHHMDNYKEAMSSGQSLVDMIPKANRH